MKPTRATQILSWFIAIAGIALAYLHELLLGAAFLALLLRPDLMAKNLFDNFEKRHPLLLSVGLAFTVLSTLLLLWGLFYSGPQLLSQFGSNALWFCLSPLAVLLAVHEAQQFKSGSRTQPSTPADPASPGR